MDGVKSLSSAPVNKVRDAMSQATQERSLDIVEQSEDMAQARRNSSATENVLVRTTQTDCGSPVSTLLSAEKAVPQATPPTSLDILGQSEDMPPGKMKISSAIGNELAMLLVTPPASSDILGQSEDMPLGKMKMSSAIGSELAMLLAIPPASSDIVGPLEDMGPGQRNLSSAIENELVRTPQADCRSPVSSLLSVEKAIPQATPPISSDIVGQSEDMAPGQRKISFSMENELVRTPQADC